tara:strand:- start:114 stop:500 length:387 start_codon:yes stop_codon:yes gene_type:complete
MAFKMKGMSFGNSPIKQKKGTKMDPVRSTVGTQKKDPYTKEDYDFLEEQREERVNVMDYLSKTPRGPVETEGKKGNVEKFKEKNKQYVDKDKTIPLDPGFEDTEKIQKVQREGITPRSQNFAKKKKKK